MMPSYWQPKRPEWIYRQDGISYLPTPNVLRQHCERLRAEINASPADDNPIGRCGEIAGIWRAMEAIGGEIPPCPAWAVGLLEREADGIMDLMQNGAEWTRQDVRDALNVAIGWCDGREKEPEPLTDNEELADAAVRAGCRTLKEIEAKTGIPEKSLSKHTIPALKAKRGLKSRPYRYT